MYQYSQGQTNSYIRSFSTTLLTWMRSGFACQWALKTITAFGLTFCVISSPIFWSTGYTACSLLYITSGWSQDLILVFIERTSEFQDIHLHDWRNRRVVWKPLSHWWWEVRAWMSDSTELRQPRTLARGSAARGVTRHRTQPTGRQQSILSQRRP